MGSFLHLFYAAYLLTAASDARELQCVRSFTPQGVLVVGFTSDKDMTWPEVQERCPEEHPGYWMLMRYEYFTTEELALCPFESLVPIGIIKDGVDLLWNSLDNLQKHTLQPDELQKVKDPVLNGSGIWGALRWPYGGLVLIGPETKFRCVVCQISDRSKVITDSVYPLHNNSIYAYDIELVSNDKVDDVGLVANGSDFTNRLLRNLAQVFNISVEALRYHGAKLNDDRKAVVHVYYEPGDDKMGWQDYLHWNDEDFERKTIVHFEITSITLTTECSVGRTNKKDINREAILTGIVDYSFNISATTVIARECYWDGHPEVERAKWSNYVVWKVNFSPCSLADIIDPSAVHGNNFTNALKNIDLACAFQLHNYLDQSDSDITLLMAVAGLKIFLGFHNIANVNSMFAILSFSMLQNLAQVFTRAQLSYGKPTELLSSKLVNILASNQESTNPVKGLSVTLPCSENRNKYSVSQLNYADSNVTIAKVHLVITVSDSIAFTTKRLVIATYATHFDLPNKTASDESLIESWLSIVQVTFTINDSQQLKSEKTYIDIAFNATFHKDTFKGKCAERVFAKDEWYGGNCVILKSMRDALTVCRCKNIPNEMNVANGVYLVYGFDASFSSYLANNLNLVIVMICVCIMSALGFFSVILTAIMFKKWREDQGHQIFLQMIFSLAVNLLIGFVNSFFKIDTKSIACIAIGVVRHYSFLAMFFWMMILSSLQIKRLTTISGLKSTTHLLLKVSLIAWGLPMIPIVVLLSWNPGFYKSEISDRGYCFLEGIAFQATVQAPAGVILIANMFIFLVILNHIYGWFKCGETMVVRKHTNERAEQLRRLTTSIFIFFLFGFTWLFHFLSEEGIINSEFLFEFLFLITASFHIFMLSIFFILLDKNTRKLWLKSSADGKWPWSSDKKLARQKVIVGTQQLQVKAQVEKAKRGRAVRVKKPRTKINVTELTVTEFTVTQSGEIIEESSV